MSAVKPPKPPAIPGYQYREPIGSGGSSFVYLYDEQAPFRAVAVKMPRTFGPDGERSRLFVAEANTMARLGHEKPVVPVLTLKEAVDGTPCLVTAYYEHGDLHKWVKRQGPLPVAEVLTVGRQLADAVAAAHAIGLLHQDIKPANVFIAVPGSSYRLGDFGIARSLKYDEGTFALSPAWAAPEVMRSASAIATERSDIYSLGATLWHLLSGSAPFVIPRGDNSADSLKQRTLAGQPTPSMARQGVPPQLTKLLLRMLALDPRDRPQSAAEVLHELTRIAEGGLSATTTIDQSDDEIESTVRRERSGPPGPRFPDLRALDDASAPPIENGTDVEDDRTVLHAKGPSAPPPAPGASAYEYPWSRDALAENQTIGSYTVLKDRSPQETLTDDRGTVVGDPNDSDVPRKRRRGLVISLGAAAAAAIAVIVALATLSTGGSANGNAPGTSGVSASAPGHNPVDPGVLGADEPPGPATVTATRTDPHTLHFSWTYSAALASDTFRWQTPDGKQAGTAKTPALDLPDPAGTRLCVEIKVVRLDGSNADPDWSRPGCGQ